MAKYMLLLKGGVSKGYSAEDLQKMVEKYMAWADKLRTEDRYRAGEELQTSGKVLRKEGQRVVDGPYVETKETVGGFFLIEAKNFDDAITISRECPHLDFGGEIEIHEVIPH